MNRVLSSTFQKIKLSIATKIVETVENNIENFEIKNEFAAQINKLEGKLIKYFFAYLFKKV